MYVNLQDTSRQNLYCGFFITAHRNKLGYKWWTHLVVSRLQIKEIKGAGKISRKMSEEIHMNAQISSVRIYFKCSMALQFGAQSWTCENWNCNCTIRIVCTHRTSM